MTGRPRSRTQGLTRDAIVEAAVALADAEGVGALSMRAVARRLGVEAMSLYHHVANKDAILDGMVDAVFAEFHDPVVGEEWREQLELRCRSARAAITRHPWCLGMMDSRRNGGPATLEHHDAVLGCLRSAGFSLALTGHAFAALDAYVYGFGLQELNLPFDPGEDTVAMATEIVEAIPEGRLVWLKEYAVQRVLAPGYAFADEFEVGLALVLDGLATRLAEESSA